MKKVAILQSNYIPWKGYFDIIRHVDHFVFYDEVQFTKNDWRNRNLIKTPQGKMWLSVPVGKAIHRKISEVELQDHSWQIKHYKTLTQYYSRTTHFKTYLSLLDKLYIFNAWTHLSKMNQASIQWIAQDILNVSTEFSDSASYIGTGDRNLRLIQILQAIGASSYITGPAGLNYLDTSLFRASGIEVEVMQYGDYPEYPQMHPPFDHGVSILDMLFMTGPDIIRHFSPTPPIRHL